MTQFGELEGRLTAKKDIFVGIDARCLNTDHLRGMGKYVSEFISHIDAPPSLRWQFFGDRPESPFHAPAGVSASTELFDFRGYRFHTWEQIGLPLRARRRQVDLLHCTATSLPFWQPVPTVVTIHDMLPWRSPLDGYAQWYRYHLLPSAYRRAAAIITISESSRRDILAMWPWLAEKLHVIPHGVSDIYLDAGEFPRPDSVTGIIGDARYLLYVGGAIERKRFGWALRVYEALETTEHKLLVCGFSKAEKRTAMATLPPQLAGRVSFLPFVPERDMPGLYQHAELILYPTLFEGFGFPVLEAQAVGTPVLFSDLSSLSELKGPDAETLPVDNLDAWVETCRRILSHRQGPGRVGMEHGRAWARRFSWKESADRHLRVYCSAMR
ncbi:MAG: glycosyltransferase family 1 protein [Gammaproteobacteria bacterium]